jgi:hypothetical protein
LVFINNKLFLTLKPLFAMFSKTNIGLWEPAEYGFSHDREGNCDEKRAKQCSGDLWSGKGIKKSETSLFLLYK